jgi:transposase
VSKGLCIVSRKPFWLTDQQWSRIEPHLPADVRGKARVDERRVISGIVQVLRSVGCGKICSWRLLAKGDMQMIDSKHIKARRSAAGGKGGSKGRRLAAREEGATRRFTHSQMLKDAFLSSC